MRNFSAMMEIWSLVHHKFWYKQKLLLCEGLRLEEASCCDLYRIYKKHLKWQKKHVGGDPRQLIHMGMAGTLAEADCPHK